VNGKVFSCLQIQEHRFSSISLFFNILHVGFLEVSVHLVIAGENVLQV